MANRQYPYVIVLRRVGEGSDTDETYEVKSTNASRAMNKAKKERAEDDECEAREFQIMDAYRDKDKYRETA